MRTAAATAGAMLALAVLAARAADAPNTPTPAAQTPMPGATAHTPTSTPPPPPPLTVLWRQGLPLPEDNPPPPDLVAGAGVVIVARPGAGVVAYAADDGRPLWSSPIASETRPAVVGDAVAVAGRGALHVLALATGVERWRTDLASAPIALFAAGDRIGVAAASDWRAWTAAGAPAWRAEPGGLPLTPVVLHDDTLYAGIEGPALVAMEAASGAVRWRARLPARPESLAAHRDRLYLSGADGALYSFAMTGRSAPAWRYALVRGIGQPTASDALVYFTLLDNSVRALDARGGAQRWARVLPGRPATGAWAVGPSLAVALTSGAIVELSGADGQLRTPASTPAPATDAPVIVRLQAAAAAPDGARVYTVTIARDSSVTLTAWGRPAPAR